MIPVIPYKHLRIPTTLGIDETVRLVSSSISPRRTLENWRTPTDKDFEGSVTERGFKIQKIIHHRNSFLPVLYGRFIQTQQGTTVDIHLTMDVFIIIFTLVWFIVAGGVFLLLETGSISSGTLSNNAWYSLIAIAFFYLLIFFGFGPYARATEEFIINLFKGYRIEQQ